MLKKSRFMDIGFVAFRTFKWGNFSTNTFMCRQILAFLITSAVCALDHRRKFTCPLLVFYLKKYILKRFHTGVWQNIYCIWQNIPAIGQNHFRIWQNCFGIWQNNSSIWQKSCCDIGWFDRIVLVFDRTILVFDRNPVKS